MKIGVLSRQPDAYSNRRLIEACERRGHDVLVIDVLRCAVCISAASPQLRYRGELVTGLDTVIPRIGASVTSHGLAVLRQFEVMGVHPLNGAAAIARSRDKLHCMQALAGAGVPLPVTAFTRSSGLTRELIEMVGGPPVIVKLLHGTHGRGVVLVDAMQEAESVIEAFHALDAEFLVQQFVSEAGGCDLRCFVVGDRVVGAMLRRGKEGDFRSNLHHGGTSEPVDPTPEESIVDFIEENAGHGDDGGEAARRARP